MDINQIKATIDAFKTRMTDFNQTLSFISRTIDEVESEIERMSQEADKNYNMACPDTGKKQKSQNQSSRLVDLKEESLTRGLMIKNIERHEKSMQELQEILAALHTWYEKLQTGKRTKETKAMSDRLARIFDKAGDLTMKDIMAKEKGMYYEVRGQEGGLLNHMKYYPETQDDYANSWTLMARTENLTEELTVIAQELSEIRASVESANPTSFQGSLIYSQAQDKVGRIKTRLSEIGKLLNIAGPTVYRATFPMKKGAANPYFLPEVDKKSQKALERNMSTLSNTHMNFEMEADYLSSKVGQKSIGAQRY